MKGFNSNYAPLLGSPAISRSVSFPIRAPISAEEYASDASLSEGESFVSGEEELDYESGGGDDSSDGDALMSDVVMPRARISRDDEDFGDAFDDELVNEDEESVGDEMDDKDGSFGSAGEEGNEGANGFLGGGDEVDKDGTFGSGGEEGDAGFLGSGEWHQETDGGGDETEERFGDEIVDKDWTFGSGVGEGDEGAVGFSGFGERQQEADVDAMDAEDGTLGSGGGDGDGGADGFSGSRKFHQETRGGGDVIDEEGLKGVVGFHGMADTDGVDGEVEESGTVESRTGVFDEHAIHVHDDFGALETEGWGGVPCAVEAGAELGGGAEEKRVRDVGHGEDGEDGGRSKQDELMMGDGAGGEPLGSVESILECESAGRVMGVGDDFEEKMDAAALEEEGGSKCAESVLGNTGEVGTTGRAVDAVVQTVGAGECDEVSSMESGVTSVDNCEIEDEVVSANLKGANDEPVSVLDRALADSEEVLVELESSNMGNDLRCDTVDGFDVHPTSVLDQRSHPDVDTSKHVVDGIEDEEYSFLFEGSHAFALEDSMEVSSNISHKAAELDKELDLEIDELGDGNEMIDLAALASVLNAATGASVDAEVHGSEEGRRLREKIEQLRVKYLRLLHRLGRAPDDSVALQVLYRLSLSEALKHMRQANHAFSIESATRKALQLEENGSDDLDFSCNILVLGKSGVGKSATINSIFGEMVSATNAFALATRCVKVINGVVDGVRFRVIDTPGLGLFPTDQTRNKKVLSSVKKHMKKHPPDVLLYVDRIDTLTSDFDDLPLLQLISSVLGSSIWTNAVAVLTHASYVPMDGIDGIHSSYDALVAKRSHTIQYSMRLVSGNMRQTNPVALVENHPSCRRNGGGEMVLPNGEIWRSHLLLLCYSLKILSEANSVLKLRDPSQRKMLGFPIRVPPISYLLSTLLQSRSHPKLLFDEMDGIEDDEVDEYDQLPPFRPLTKSQISMLSKEHKKAYFDEYDYRVRLLEKKEMRDGLRKVKEATKSGNEDRDNSDNDDMMDDYVPDGSPDTVPVPLPDMVLPLTFDGDDPCYRYRGLEPTSQLLARPVSGNDEWDHDCGYDGISLEDNLIIAGRLPAAFSLQVTKDKKACNLHLDSSVSAKHGDHASTVAGFDLRTMGEQVAYMLHGEAKLKKSKRNEITGGMSLTFVGEDIVSGLKVEDRVHAGRADLLASFGTIYAQRELSCAANLEAQLRDEDVFLARNVLTLGLSLVKLRSDLAIGANLRSQHSIGRGSKMVVTAGLNSKCQGQISVRTSTSEQLQIALLGILPVTISIFKKVWPGKVCVD